MPIDKNKYHPNFHKRRDYCIKRAKYTCQQCFKKRGDRYVTQQGKIEEVVIQAAHINHDPMNPRAKLKALCTQCHMKYDGDNHGKHAALTKRRKKIEKQLEDGQLYLPGFVPKPEKQKT
jgi:5-methylcytosine-specific restriction endonuclease McrA